MQTTIKYDTVVNNGTHFIREKNKLIIFDYRGYVNVIVGYPVWRAYYKSVKKNMWGRYRPEIDLFRETLKHIPSRPIKYIDRYNNVCYKKLSRPVERQLLIPFKHNYHQIKDEECKNQFFSTVPADIKELCTQFRYRQWALVSSCLANDKFMELLKLNPVLAFMLANLWVFNKKVLSGKQHSYIQNKLRLKQKDILGYTGFPDTNNFIKIIKKLNPELVTIIGLLGLRELVKETHNSKRAIKVLSHLKNINNDIHGIVSNPSIFDIVTNKFIWEIQEKAEEGTTINVLPQLYNILNKSKTLKITLNPIDTISKLKRVSRDLYIKELNICKVFPTPPLVDTENIKALRTEKELIDWGEYQNNCIGEHLSEVYLNLKYYYSVCYETETATFEVLINEGELSLGQILGPDNKKCGFNIINFVNNYFTNQQVPYHDD